jgi:predicted nucleic acid-binding protein
VAPESRRNGHPGRAVVSLARRTARFPAAVPIYGPVTRPVVLWADEPDELDAVWRAMSARDDKSHKLWTDDYLAAFAQAGDLTLATLDRKLPVRYPSVRVESLLS